MRVGYVKVERDMGPITFSAKTELRHSDLARAVSVMTLSLKSEGTNEEHLMVMNLMNILQMVQDMKELTQVCLTHICLLLSNTGWGMGKGAPDVDHDTTNYQHEHWTSESGTRNTRNK